ncbi:MAG: hypothetical protein HYW22_00305 [Candidatus Aenigmarchaeota archaeon]|nr:hypothetical protein [Candidatus Aenigmarchaeota archaeon]
MVWREFIAQVLGLTSSFNLEIGLLLFLLTILGELVPAVPYVLETFWLLAGYQLSMEVLQFQDLVLLWLTAQVGRQLGAYILYKLAMHENLGLIKWYKKSLAKLESEKKKMKIKFIHRINFTSPFFLAFGRLIGLHIPLTLYLSIKRKLRMLQLSVLVSSIVSDITFIIIGFIAHKVAFKPLYLIFYSLIGLTVFYSALMIARFFFSNGEKKSIFDIFHKK